MNSKELCLRILRAESESQVTEIIGRDDDLADNENWFAIDGRDTNFNVVTNQASTGSKALTELCTNMVDAVLMKCAYERGIDPTGADAPQSVVEGVRKLVELRGARSGLLSEVDDRDYLREFATEHLVIGVNGGTRRDQSLCFTFVDNGEGQHPQDFDSTFLSLSRGNKSGVPFVQGKYNMGSSGVLSYCGRQWYKLIVSRRYDGSGDWGWTLVRRRPGDGMPVAEYFKFRGEIPAFPPSPLHPLYLQDGHSDEKQIHTGTIVKLYEYQMRQAVSFRDIREALNENLTSTVLPFRIMDYRYKADTKRRGRRAQGIDERQLHGMEYLLLRGDSSGIEQLDEEDEAYQPGHEEHVGNIDHPDLGHITVRAIILPKKLPGWLKPPRNISRVFHAVNGQVQFKQTRGYLSRCKFPGLKDRIVLIVDASDLSEAAHNDVWKGDRENIRETVIGTLYGEQVTNLITSSDYLKTLQHRIAREEAENLTEKSQQVLFQDLIDADPNIAQLLPSGTVVTLPGHVGRSVTEEDDYEGKYSPTFLHLVGRRIKDEGAEIAIGGKRSVAFKTDAANDYFTRSDNRGRTFVTGGTRERLPYSTVLRNGRLTVMFQALSEKVEVGEEINFSVGLIDDAILEPVTEDLKLLVVADRTTSPSGPHREPPDPEVDGDAEATEGRALPPTKWLTRDGRLLGGDATDAWPEDFTDQDGGEVRDLGEGQKLYCLNYDNAHFRHFLDRERDDVNKKVITEQYRIGMLVLMMGFEDACSRTELEKIKTEIEEHIDEFRRLAAQGAATVVMSIAKTLPTIVNPASVADPDD